LSFFVSDFSFETPAVWRLSSTPVLSFTSLDWPGEHEAGMTCRGQHIRGSCHYPIRPFTPQLCYTGFTLELPPRTLVSKGRHRWMERSTSSRRSRKQG
jgi:hypothetical protein